MHDIWCVSGLNPASLVLVLYSSLKSRRFCAGNWIRVLNLAGLTPVIQVSLWIRKFEVNYYWLCMIHYDSQVRIMFSHVNWFLRWIISIKEWYMWFSCKTTSGTLAAIYVISCKPASGILASISDFRVRPRLGRWQRYTWFRVRPSLGYWHRLVIYV